jgi:hypothetical protein
MTIMRAFQILCALGMIGVLVSLAVTGFDLLLALLAATADAVRRGFHVLRLHRQPLALRAAVSRRTSSNYSAGAAAMVIVLCALFAIAAGATFLIPGLLGKGNAYATTHDKDTSHAASLAEDPGAAFDQVQPFTEGRAIVKKGPWYGVVDEDFNTIVPVTYPCIKPYSEGLAAFRLKGAWGYLDRSGRVAIAPRFYAARSFSEGLAAANIDYRWGYIDPTGRMVIRPNYLVALEFVAGQAQVALVDQGIFLIDRSGSIIKEDSRS